MNRKLVPLFILSLTFLDACGGGGASSTGGGGTGPQPIAVTFQALPPSSMMTGDNVAVSATVTNDSKNGGVSWTSTPAGACGTFNPTNTASGANTTYLAPGSVPSGGKVTLIAAAVTDTTKNAQAQVSITTPPPPAIAVSISTPPLAAMTVSGTAISATAAIAATTNDTAGVTWSCTPAGSCGTFNPNSTASTTTTTYTPPAAVPTSTGGKVTLTATSVTDTTKSASAPVLITGVARNASLKGQYAFIVSAPTGNPVSRGITTWIGSIAFDGAGNVLGGIEDIVSPQYHDEADPILATVAGQTPTTHYNVDASGHGTLLMLTQHGETLNMSFVVTSTSHAVAIELDGEPGSGTLDLQTPPAGGFSTSQFKGAYSFTMTGIDAPAPPPAAPPPYRSFGGTLSSDGLGNVTRRGN